MGFGGSKKDKAAIDLEALTTLSADDILSLSGGITVNEGAEDVDFRVESQTNTHALIVDASTSRVGINLSAPKTALTVEGTLTLKEQANADSDTAAYGQLWIKNTTPNELYFTTDAGDDIRITNGTNLAAPPSSGAVAADDITTGDAATSVATSSGNVTIDSQAGSVLVDGHTGVTVTSSNSGEVDITSAANVDINATTGVAVDGTTVSIGGTDDSNLTVTGSAKDLDIAVAGGGTQELRLASAGTGASALHLNASAGSVDIDSADNITVDAADEIVITTTSADGHIALVSAHTAGVAFHIDANANADSEVQIDAGVLDVDVTAGITIDGTAVSIDGTDDSNLTVTGSAKDLDIAVAGGGTQELRLASAGTGASALHLNASAGSVDIDSADAITVDAADEIVVTTTSADGHIALVSAHTAGLAFHIDANADADSEVQIDAGVLDVDVTGAATIDAVGIALGAGSGELDLTTTGTLDVNANALDMDLTDSSSITITSSEAAEDLTIEQVGANDSSIIIQAAGTGTDAIHLNASAGSIDIDSADNITVDAADEIVITTGSADGHIALVSAHTSGVAFHIDANADAASEVQIDAGILDIDVTGAATLDAASLDITSDAVTFTSANADDPLVQIKNTTDDATGARLRFVKDKGGAGAADDVAGLIEFYADDANQDQVLFSEIKSQVAVHTNGQEGGKLTLSVASHDGESQPGLIISDGSAEDEVDVTLGNGDGSLTTISGDLKLAHDSANIQFGADGDVVISHAHNTGLTVSLPSNTTAKPIFHLKNTGDLASGPGLRFVADNGAGEADDETLGFIDFKGDDSGDAETVYAKLEARATDISDGDEGGMLVFQVMSGGTAGTASLQEALMVGGEDVNASTPAEVCVNRLGTGFIDFRALTDNNSHALFVDASADAVGINNNAPSKELDVAGDALVTSSATSADSVGVVANSLTTGSALSVSSSSSNTSARNLVEVTNSNGSAVATVGMHVNVTGQFGVTSTKQIASTQNLTNKSNGTGQTLSTTEVLNGSIIRTGPSGDYQDTLPTAAQLVAAVPNATVGMFFDFNFYNGTGHTATVAGGSGIVMLDNNGATFDLTGGQFRVFRLFFTDVSSSSESAYMIPMSAAMNPLA